MPTNKTCTKCGLEKELRFFYSNRSECSECTKTKQREYYAANRQTVIKRVASYDLRTNRRH